VRGKGDRVRSAGDIKRIARLRPHEPLWRARLDAAARDVALHLTRDGYLEAQVGAEAVATASGADALLTIHTGPRARLGSVSLEGADPASAVAAQVLLPHSGDAYRRATAENRAERIRKQLVE